MTIELIHEQAYKTIAAHLTKAGLRIEDNFRVADQGFAVTHRAADVLKATGCPVDVPSNDSLAGVGISRFPFLHPLSAASGENFNLWGSASILISAALGWLPSEPQPQTTAAKNIRKLVSRVAPTVDIAALLEASRYSDQSLLKLTSLLHQALEQASSDSLKTK